MNIKEQNIKILNFPVAFKSEQLPVVLAGKYVRSISKVSDVVENVYINITVYYQGFPVSEVCKKYF